MIAAHDVSDEVDALSGLTGALKWKAILGTDLSIPEHSRSAVSVSNGLVYAGFSANGRNTAMVAAFDANGVTGCSNVSQTCNPLWTAPLGDVFQARTPVLADTSMFASQAFGLNVYDAAGVKRCTGKPKTCSPLWFGVAPFATPAVANGIVFDGGVAFDALGKTGCSGVPKTCQPLWTNASGYVNAVANGVRVLPLRPRR